MVIYALTEEQLWELEDIARAEATSAIAFPCTKFNLTSRNIDRIFEEFKSTTGWRGLDAENAIESFIRFVGKAT